MCACVYHFMQYSRAWASVWAGVSGASTTNFRSYRLLIVWLKEFFSSLVFSSLFLQARPHVFQTVVIIPLFYSSSLFPSGAVLLSSSHLPSCVFLLLHPSVSVRCFSWSFLLHQYFPTNPPIVLATGGPKRTGGRRPDSRSNRSSDQWTLYIATVTPK